MTQRAASSSSRSGYSRGKQNEPAPVQARDSTQSYTVAENGQVLPAFVPQEDQAAKARH